MRLQYSQFTIIENEINTTPLLSWDIVKLLLWDLDATIFHDLDKIAISNNWYFKYFIDGYSHFKNYAIVLVDHELNICAASPNIKKITGYESNEMIGKAVYFSHGAATNSDCKFLSKIAIDEEIPFHSRLVNYDRDGNVYGCETRAFPIFNKSGKLCHYIAFKQAYSV
ncbi:PAS domain S-box-containing protein [Nonlabens dokdonensis]|jgi:PAS domain S-box-containing protein|uniref:PAS domain S-box-containing protein n=2 Tax=Nonlabens dokdonensis TaxID=328515 RepID=A0ABX5Q1Z6_9FLAO|nr:putative signal transduction histidine kinase [Nonlabens dokdonensis DSW-6]PZX44062.1 PAS domain S-box-containing protein [Nonlabens dokdonensis]